MSAGQPRFTVGSAPHWRRNSSLFRMNHAFIVALVPMAVLGAIVHAFGWRNVQLDGAFGPINPMLSTAVNEMGVDSGALWLLGIFGTLALGMGTAVIVEYFQARRQRVRDVKPRISRGMPFPFLKASTTTIMREKLKGFLQQEEGDLDAKLKG